MDVENVINVNYMTFSRQSTLHMKVTNSKAKLPHIYHNFSSLYFFKAYVFQISPISLMHRFYNLEN